MYRNFSAKQRYLKNASEQSILGVIQKVRHSGGVGVCAIFVTNCYEKCKGWGEGVRLL